ncbi:MAG: two-component system, OmpR family, sensor histidine kinase MprB [Solirubrobacteraceae bacterium]|nr:two-component system, OmpR family, sensor histidine kinase MprB [Solirubrobacteraceae bacterium]
MPLRRRLALVAAAAVGVAILLVAIVSYTVVKGQLRGQVDDTLRAQAALVAEGNFHALDVPTLPANAGGGAPYVEVVQANGDAGPLGQAGLPVTPIARAVAHGRPGEYLSDVWVGRNHLREITVPFTYTSLQTGQQTTVGVELARPLSGVDGVLSNLRLILVLLCAAGIALAAMLGRLAARRVLSPLAEVAQAAEHIGETEDLTTRIQVRADDEVGQLATRFNAMLDRLESSRAAVDESVRAQRQLVADASHELRTPVTSLRTNVEVLLEGGALSDEDRERLLSDVVEQSEELSALVNDLIELARGDQPIESPDDIRLDGIVEEAIDRARRNSPGITIDADLEPVVVDGVPERLLRAVNNLLDNAIRHTQPGTAIEVRVDRNGVRVRDHGDGVDPADLPHVFDRFYRGVNSRGRQGSGLGLAIVRQVAELHGGSVTASNAPDGGAVFEIRLPTTRRSAEPVESLGADSARVRSAPLF